MNNFVRFVLFLSVIAVLAIMAVVARNTYDAFMGNAPAKKATPTLDLSPEIEIEAVARLRLGTAVWNVTLRNVSRREIYSDIEYSTHYHGESGKMLRSNSGTFTIMLAPGETRDIQGFDDGYVPQQVARANMSILGAKALRVRP